MDKDKRIPNWQLTIVVLIPFLSCLCLFLVYSYPTIRHAITWRDKTTPLTQEVAKDICEKFQIPTNDKRCQPGNTVYAPDFFEEIVETFREKDGRYATYAEVQEKLGEYQYKFEEPVTESNGFAYYVVHYDLCGDRVYPIGMFFDSEDRVIRIAASISD